MAIDYNSLLSELEALESDPALLSQVPDQLRERLSHAARLVSVKLESPAETLARLIICQPAEEACVRIAADMKLFSAMGSSDAEPKTAKKLAGTTHSDEVLLKRLLRCLAANGAVLESPEGYALSPSFALLADNNMAQAYGPCESFLRQNYTAMPQFLADSEYIEPSSATNTVIQRAFSMSQPGMEIIASNVEAFKGFRVLMSTWQDGFVQFHSLYPVESQVIAAFDASKSDTILVDVGGGFGQKAIALKTAFPNMPGRIIVQDLPRVIDFAPAPSVAVELTAHDFFELQPVKSAKVYYLRQILHNWTDDKATQILGRIRDAMLPGYSILVIHEIVMPDRNASRWATSQDFQMLNMFASRQRTEEQWRDLCVTSGFGKINFFLGANSAHEAVIEVQI